MKFGFTLLTILSILWCAAPPARGEESQGGPTEHSSTIPEEIRVFSNVQAPRKYLSLMDIVDPSTIPDPWKELMRARDIGEAPALGKQKVVRPEKLRIYLELFLEANGADPSRVKLRVPPSIQVVRASRRLDHATLEKIFTDYVLSHTSHAPEDVSVEKVRARGSPILPAGDWTHEVKGEKGDRLAGSVALTVDFFVDGEKARSLEITGRVEIYQRVVHARIPLDKDTVLEPFHVELRRAKVPSNSIPYATRLEEVVGKKLARDLESGTPIHLRMLDKHVVVEKGAPVTIVHRDGGLKLTAKGLAEKEGGVGDVIQVSNLSSHRTVVGRVVDSETVLLLP